MLREAAPVTGMPRRRRDAARRAVATAEIGSSSRSRNLRPRAALLIARHWSLHARTGVRARHFLRARFLARALALALPHILTRAPTPAACPPRCVAHVLSIAVNERWAHTADCAAHGCPALITWRRIRNRESCTVRRYAAAHGPPARWPASGAAIEPVLAHRPACCPWAGLDRGGACAHQAVHA